MHVNNINFHVCLRKCECWLTVVAIKTIRNKSFVQFERKRVVRLISSILRVEQNADFQLKSKQKQKKQKKRIQIESQQKKTRNEIVQLLLYSIGVVLLCAQCADVAQIQTSYFQT